MSRCSRDLYKMAEAGAFPARLGGGGGFSTLFAPLAKEAVSTLNGAQRRVRGEGGRRGEGHRSILREIFVDLQRHYRHGARWRTRQPVSTHGIWRRRKRVVNPLFTPEEGSPSPLVDDGGRGRGGGGSSRELRGSARCPRAARARAREPDKPVNICLLPRRSPFSPSLPPLELVGEHRRGVPDKNDHAPR